MWLGSLLYMSILYPFVLPYSPEVFNCKNDAKLIIVSGFPQKTAMRTRCSEWFFSYYGYID